MNNSERTPYLLSGCGFRSFDIAFGIPVSSLVTSENFLFLKLMLSSYIQRADITSGDARVGVFMNSLSQGDNIVNLEDFSSRELLLTHVLNFTRAPSVFSVSVRKALDLIEVILQSNDNRADVQDIAFLTVDTNSDFMDTHGKAQELREKDIELHVIAIGFTDLSMPQSISYMPGANYVYAVDSYPALASDDLPFTSFHLDKCSK